MQKLYKLTIRKPGTGYIQNLSGGLMQLQNNAITEFFIGSFFCQIEHTERLQTVSYFIYSLSFLVYALYIGHRLCHLRNNTYIYIYIYIYTGWRKKKLTCLIYFNLKTKRAITPKLRALHSVLSNLNFDIRPIRDAGTTGAAGASAPLAFCIFNFVGAVRVQTRGATGAHNFYNRQN